MLFQDIFKSIPRRTSRARPALTGAMLVVWGILAVFPAGAQTQPAAQSAAPVVLPGLIFLKEGEDRLKIGPRTYVTRDERNAVNYTTLIENHLTGRRGATADKTILSLGATPVPSWLIFSVKNDTRTNRHWVLSLGGHADGRYGAVKKMFLYDHLSQRYALYAMPDKKGIPPARESLPLYGTGIPFELAPGQQALMVLYIVPETGMPVTLVPEIMTQHAFWQGESGFFNRAAIVPATLLAALGLFCGLLVFSRQLIALPVILYLGAQIALFAVQDQEIYSSFPLASEITPLLFMLMSVSALLLAKFFLNIKDNKDRSSLTIYSLMLVSAFSAAICVFVLPDTMTGRTLLLALVPLINLGVIAVISATMRFHGKPAAGFFAVGWFVLFCGAAVSILALAGILPATSIVAGSYWIALLIQIPVLSGAVFLRQWLMHQDSEKTENVAGEEAESISRIRQAKDGAENTRLLRVIEHERQMLQDLRDREIEQNEAMRKAKENADMANRAKSAFLAVISHEIRTPMSGVMGMVRLLLETQLNKDQRDYARTIQDSGDAMLALLNDILDFEKIESGNLDLEVIDFDLPRLINDIITLMSAHATQKGIFLRAELGPDIPRYVRGDPVRLRQVLLNLTGNALKFTSEGGVTLGLKRTDWEGVSQKGMARLTFSIRDTGIGISKDAQKNLFNPFSQADSSITRKYGGTGLGLTICQRLIEAMGGEILIDSTEGEGSTFYYTIALEEGQADQVSESGTAAISRGAGSRPEKVLTILCVDDNEVNQKLLKEFVGRLGHQPILAGSGEEAIEKVKAFDVDMAFMDIELPGISGMGATRAIRSLPDDAKATIPVIAMTGHVRDEDVRACYAANMNGHLAKPVDPEKLKLQIEKVLKSALDNPVELGDDRTTLKSAPQESRISPTLPPAALPPEDVPLPGLRDNDGIEDKQKDMDENMNADEEQGIPDHNANVSPLRVFAMSELSQENSLSIPKNFGLRDEDLDEDSFARAIEVSDSAAGGMVFDHAMLNNLKKSMKPVDLQDMIDSLTDKADEIIDALQQAISQGDAETLTARGHELKGMCGNFGLRQLSEIGSIIEKAAREKSLDGLAEIIDALPETNSRAKQAIHSWIRS